MPPPRDSTSWSFTDASFTYLDDVGDYWEHTILVEKVLDALPVDSLPACIGGRSAGPPEDCGGAPGYEQPLAILADTSHHEPARATEWATAVAGAALDPAAFDPTEFADKLRSPHPARFDD